MKGYFNGVYLKCQSKSDTVAMIPAYHKTKEGEEYATIQLITEKGAHYLRYPIDKWKMGKGPAIMIDKNIFCSRGVKLDIAADDLKVKGRLRFDRGIGLGYDIMGIFKYMPCMECRHSVYSLRHTVNGKVKINNKTYKFENAVGYMEGDRGSSFPKSYAWTQCLFPEGSVMMSVADIPFLGYNFNGTICVLLIGRKQMRFATYLGGKVVRACQDEIAVKQGNYLLRAKRLDDKGHELHAPVNGDMSRRIKQCVAARVQYTLEYKGRKLWEYTAKQACFEWEE